MRAHLARTGDFFLALRKAVGGELDLAALTGEHDGNQPQRADRERRR